MGTMVELEAGRELDALVAEKVMGWSYWKSKHGHWKVTTPSGEMLEPMYGAAKFDSQTGEPIVDDWHCGVELPEYSTDIATAWQIVEHFKPYHFELKILNDGWLCRFCIGNDNTKYFEAYGGRRNGDYHAPHNAALAICRAALRAAAAEA